MDHWRVVCGLWLVPCGMWHVAVRFNRIASWSLARSLVKKAYKYLVLGIVEEKLD